MLREPVHNNELPFRFFAAYHDTAPRFYDSILQFINTKKRLPDLTRDKQIISEHGDKSDDGINPLRAGGTTVGST
ncbi:MAG TPA: hypothetical protein VFZ67_13370 [Nitrososphaera sp.]